MKNRYNNFRFYFSMILFVSFFLTINSFAQGNKIISSVTTSEAKERTPLKIEAELNQTTGLSRIILYYKSFGQSEYQIKEMALNGRVASHTIPAIEVLPPFVEYYVKAELKDGAFETYPFGAPDEGSAMQLNVAASSPKDKEIIFLSPEAGSFASLEDLFISISLLRASDKVDRNATKLFVGDEDVTANAIISGDLVLFYPNNFPGLVELGPSTIKVELYDTEGNLYHEMSSSFTATTAAEAVARTEAFKYNFGLSGESRNETYADESTWYNNVNADFKGTYGNWDFKANVYLTSEEKEYLQPQHRFKAAVKSDWLSLEVGDNNPLYPTLIMNGSRVRGFTGALNLGFINVQSTFGEMERGIEGALIRQYTRDEAPLASNVVEIDSVRHGNPYGEIEAGTFKREVFAVRPSFGAGENFQLGFTYLHSKDDVGSIEFGTKPQENVVVGTDLMFAFDDQNFMVTSQVALSIINTDISPGSITDEQLEALFDDPDKQDDLQDFKDIKNYIDRFITVNQNLGPLNPQEFSSLAAEAGVRLNYANNTFNAKYIYRGNEFNSFGNPYTRVDVKGINITDRIRLIDNKLFINVGYEKLEDNLQETKVATTDFTTFNTSVSIFPRADFPNITIGFTRYENSNGLDPLETEINETGAVVPTNNAKGAIDDVTNRIYATLSYDIKTATRHRAYVNVSSYDREDNGFNNSDGNSISTSFMWNTFWTKDLSSTISLTYYDSETISSNVTSQYSYTMLSIGGRYRVIPGKFVLQASLSPSFGDFERQAVDIMGTYYLMQNLTLEGQIRIYRIPDQSTDSIYGVMLRYNI